MKSIQDFGRMERIVKGFANRKRLHILEFLNTKPWQSIEVVSEEIKTGYENTSDHLRKMNAAGLLLRRNEGLNVLHKLSPRAELIVGFCKKLK